MKRAHVKAIREAVPDFVSRIELAHQFGVVPATIDRWIAEGSIPPPHCRFGARTALWRRKDYEAFVRNGEWPKDSWEVVK